MNQQPTVFPVLDAPNQPRYTLTITDTSSDRYVSFAVEALADLTKRGVVGERLIYQILARATRELTESID